MNTTIRAPERLLQDRLRVIRRLDLYGRLLTERQRRLTAMYCLDDLSLSEIAESVGTTRQAVHDALRRAVAELDRYEDAMGLEAASAARKSRLEAALSALTALDAALASSGGRIGPVGTRARAVRQALEEMRE